MPSFQEMFEKSGGMPIDYQGNTLVMYDDFPMNDRSRIYLVFEKCSSEWRQGVALRFNGRLKINRSTFKNGIVLWKDSAPAEVELEPLDVMPSIEVKNVWDVGDGVIHSWHNGAAMMIEDLSNGRRYRCNDGLADDDFDDIVFRLERQ